MTNTEKNNLIALIKKLAHVTSTNADYEETHIINQQGIDILITYIKGI